jgi:SAM-dependent methyltransferase
MAGDEADALIAEQIDFYRADSAGYDRFLTSMLDPTNEAGADYRRILDWLGAFFSEAAPLGRVLEIGAGNGIVAERVAPFAHQLDLLDSSPESLAQAADRLSRFAKRVRCIERDVFTLDTPADRYDLVYFTAFLHHVPLARFDGFWNLLERLVAEGGWVLFDFPPEPTDPHPEELPASPSQEYRIYRARDGVSIRDLGGRRWRVTHVCWEPSDLATRLFALGWELQIEREDHWHVASARRRP